MRMMMMEFKADPVGYKASDGIRYETEEKAIQASMEWEMMAVLMKFYRYDHQRVAKEHARQLFELEDKGILIIDWDKVEELRKG
jgi:hypothetical protein